MADHVVRVKDFEFDPNDVRIKPGDTIVWINIGNAAHTVTSTSDLEFDENPLDPGKFFTFTFPTDIEDGDFGYRCLRHPPGMRGNVIVDSAS